MHKGMYCTCPTYDDMLHIQNVFVPKARVFVKLQGCDTVAGACLILLALLQGYGPECLRQAA
jgi:hypothetical protein